MTPGFSVVVPTLGRPSLTALLQSLKASDGPRPRRVVLVDDRPPGPTPLDLPDCGWIASKLAVRHGCARGPAAARNLGWRATDTEWVVFLDDDVVVGETWLADLARDLDVDADVGASQAVVDVPLPVSRRPTDWERSTAGLATAKWITADMAYRRSALLAVNGFDERFPRAFREDADLALRVSAHGWRIVHGTRRTTHPVRPAAWHASLHAQRGNADDALMARLHGRGWYAAADAPRGAWPAHVLTSAAIAAFVVGSATRRRRLAAAAAHVWTAGTARFAWSRIAPGPRTVDEVAAMLATSVLIPPAAIWHRARGAIRARGAAPWAPPVEAVLFDRDGTLVDDVPYNGDPDRVSPVPGCREALDELRRRGVRTGIITNQSGIARGLLDRSAVERVNRRVTDVLGPFGTVHYCPHGEDDGCSCRKPAPGMIHAAAAELGVPVERCAVVGDTGADVAAALAAGAALAVIVPTAATLPEEVAAAPARAADLPSAVELILTRVPR